MKKSLLFLRSLLFGLILLFSSGWAVGQVTISSQSFETDLTGYSHSPSQTPVSDPGDQYFYRAEPSDANIYEGSVGPYTNVTGSWLFVGSNPNTINAGSEGLLTLDGIDVSGYTDLEFYADFGACPNDWDGLDDLRVEYNFDGGSWMTLFSFAIDIASDGTNEPLELTGNAVGGINTADGAVLTYALSTIASNNFAGSGSTLNIRVACDSDANYEAFGVDNIIVKGVVSATPTPTLTITGPNGGEVAYAGQTYDIEWTSSDYTGTVDLEYYDGTTYTTIADNEVDDGSYSFTIPSDITPGTTYKIRISDDMTSITTSDESDDDFEVKSSVFISGTMNVWGGNAMDFRPSIAVTASWIYTYQELGTDLVEFKFRGNTVDWSHGNWGRGDIVNMSELTTWWDNGNNSTFTPTADKYYTFIHKDVAVGADGEGYVFETAAMPVTISAVEHSPALAMMTDAVEVTVTTSAEPSVGERCYVMYTVDGGANFEFVQASFTGTSGVAIIPAQVAGTNVMYFPLTTGDIADMTTVDWEQAYIDILLEGSYGGGYGYTVYEPSSVIINEVDADTEGTDALEFIELYDGGTGSTTLDGLVLVLYNGSDDLSYAAYDLDGYTSGLDGYFVVGNSLVDNVAIVFADNFLQNGADAVALYYGDAADFPNGTPVTTNNLIDAFVYDTNDGDDAGLLVLLNASEPQVNEAENSNSAGQSSQRITNGTGGARNTSTYQQAAPTPGAMNYGETTFTGAFDGDMVNPLNWSNGVPTTDFNVVIPAGLPNYPFIAASSTVNVNNLTVEAGAEFTINATGVLVSNNPIVINSGATGSGSFINNGTLSVGAKKSTSGLPVNLIYNRYIDDSEWHLLSAPVVGQTVNGLLTNADNQIELTGSDYSMKNYNTSGDTWNSLFTASTTGYLDSGYGYAVKRIGAGTISMVGAYASSVVIDALSWAGNRWNLIGNPYPSAISANSTAHVTDNFLTSNAGSLDPSYTALYVWDYVSASYLIINHVGGTPGVTLSQDYIQAGQGFFVKSKDLDLKIGVSVSITSAMQSHQPTLAFKSDAEAWPMISLKALSENGEAATQIVFNNQMTKGLDAGYDGGLLTSNPSFSLYTRLVEDNGVDFMLQALPDDYANLVVPVGLRAKSGEIVTFSASSVNIPQDYAVVLEDRAMNVFTDLSDDATYAVQLTSDAEGIGRFFVHTSFKSALGVGDLNPNAFEVFTRVRENQLVVRGEFNANSIAKIYSITGKQLAEVSLKQVNENLISFNQEAGVYIVQISNESGTYTQKFSWVK